MKKIIHGLLGALLLVSTAGVNAATVHSNQTYMSVRPAGDHLMGMNWAGRSTAAKAKNSIGASVSVSGFYHELNNASDVAQYFGGGRSNSTVLTAPDGTMEVKAGTKKGLTPNQVKVKDTALDGSVALKPHHQQYGANLNYEQCLSSFVDGLSFSVNVPFVQVERGMGASSADTTISQYFAGSYSSETAAVAQDALAFGRVDAEKRSKTGVADVHFGLGYNLVNDKAYNVKADLLLIAPTGSDVDAKNMFEASYGTKHFALGGGLSGSVNVWNGKENNCAVDLTFAAQYKYLFEATQKRTVGATEHGASANAVLFPYRLVAKVGDTAAYPAANVSTVDVKVEPGSHFQALAGASVRWNGFCFDVAYNLYAREAETNKLKASWTSEQYAEIHATTIDLSDGVVVGELQTATYLNDTGVKTSSFYIDPATAATPSQVTHAGLASVGYGFNCAKMPVNVSAGALYEYAQSNDAAGVWGVFGKLGVSF